MRLRRVGWGMLAVLTAVTTNFSKPPQTHQKSQDRSAETSPPPANKLDTARIHAKYLESDFDPAIEAIEDARKYGGPFSHQDSIFMFKHLGVMYTARYETREKGKQYLLALLEVEPTAKILDMYASDMIYMIFKNVKDEFEAENPHRLNGYRPLPQPGSDSARPAKTRGYAWLGWSAGAAGVVGSVVAAMHFLEEAQAGKGRDYSSNE